MSRARSLLCFLCFLRFFFFLRFFSFLSLLCLCSLCRLCCGSPCHMLSAFRLAVPFESCSIEALALLSTLLLLLVAVGTKPAATAV